MFLIIVNVEIGIALNHYSYVQRSIEIIQVDIEIFFPDRIQVTVDGFRAINHFVTQLELDVRITRT